MCHAFRAITLTEALICVKFGKDLFSQTIRINIVYWLVTSPYLYATLQKYSVT